ncbi:MAG: hypothetical protein J6T30_00710, partial [Bacteroidales bacterium]|nr:hypothetical protein [Bacteroidales bacterium]
SPPTGPIRKTAMWRRTTARWRNGSERSRTSSPIRILRDSDTLEHVSRENLYPCGEGSGYAGGIVSSAVDGTRVAEEIAKKYKG